MKHKCRHLQQAELARHRTQVIDIFFHRIADKDKRAQALSFTFPDRVLQHLADLRMAAEAMDGAHMAYQAA